MRGAAIVAMVGWLLVAAAPVQASDRGVVISDLASLQKACRRAEHPGARKLYVVRVPSARLGRYDADAGFLPVDTSRNLRALDGSAELFPADMEPVGFEVSADRAAALRRRARHGALRVGFFLGFDDRDGTLCLIRSRFAVTTVRMDLAFVELLDDHGKLLARQTTDRLRAWLDDLAKNRVPGEGPRGVLRAATASSRGGTVPDAWQRAIDAANGGPVTGAIGRCHAQATASGGAAAGRVIVRLVIDPQSGRVRDAGVELSTVAADESACVARAVGTLSLPPAAHLGASPVALSVPVQLAK